MSAKKNRFSATKKWLGKDAQAGLNIRPAQAALSAAERAKAEYQSLKAKLSEAASAKKATRKALKNSLDMVREEKELKRKQASIQAKIASLGAAQAK